MDHDKHLRNEPRLCGGLFCVCSCVSPFLFTFSFTNDLELHGSFFFLSTVIPTIVLAHPRVEALRGKKKKNKPRVLRQVGVPRPVVSSLIPCVVWPCVTIFNLSQSNIFRHNVWRECPVRWAASCGPGLTETNPLCLPEEVFRARSSPAEASRPQ